MLDSSNAYFSLNILGKKVLVKEIAYYLFDKKHVGRNRMLTLGHLLAGCKIEIWIKKKVSADYQKIIDYFNVVTLG